MNQRSYDLEERLVKYSCQVMDVIETLAGKMVSGIETVTKENEKLIAIISKSITTANRNKKTAP